MALIGAIDFFGNRIVRNSGNVSMTVTAFDTSVNAMVVKCFINIIIPSPAVFIDSSHLSMFVAQETFIFISRFGGGSGQKKHAYDSYQNRWEDIGPSYF